MNITIIIIYFVNTFSSIQMFTNLCNVTYLINRLENMRTYLISDCKFIITRQICIEYTYTRIVLIIGIECYVFLKY